jgi:hypothetical protein
VLAAARPRSAPADLSKAVPSARARARFDAVGRSRCAGWGEPRNDSTERRPPEREQPHIAAFHCFRNDLPAARGVAGASCGDVGGTPAGRRGNAVAGASGRLQTSVAGVERIRCCGPALAGFDRVAGGRLGRLTPGVESLIRVGAGRILGIGASPRGKEGDDVADGAVVSLGPDAVTAAVGLARTGGRVGCRRRRPHRPPAVARAGSGINDDDTVGSFDQEQGGQRPVRCFGARAVAGRSSASRIRAVTTCSTPT